MYVLRTRGKGWLLLKIRRGEKGVGEDEVVTEVTVTSGLHAQRERRWFVLKRPRCDINGGSETEVTVTSKRHARAERGDTHEQKGATRTSRKAGCRARPRARAADDLSAEGMTG